MTAFPVEIVNLEHSNWTWPTVITLIISLSALVVSASSAFFQYFTWKRDGALIRLTAYVRPGVPPRKEISAEGQMVMQMLGQPSRLTVIARNEGRKDAFIGPLFLAIGKDLQERTLILNQHTFPSISASGDRVLIPGDYAEAMITPEEVWGFCGRFDLKLSQVRLVADSLGRPCSIKLSRSFREELNRSKKD